MRAEEGLKYFLNLIFQIETFYCMESFSVYHLVCIAAHIFSISNTMIDATPPPPSRRPLGNVDTNRLNSRQSCILHKHMLCIHCHEACKSCEPTTGCIGCEASRSVSPNKGGRPKKKRRGRHFRSIQRNLSSQSSSQTSDATMDSQLEMIVNENQPVSPLRENFNLSQPPPAAIEIDDETVMVANERPTATTAQLRENSIISHSQSILAVEGAVEEDNENEDMEDGERGVEQSSVLQATQNEQIEQAAEIEQSLTECIDLLHQGMVPSNKLE